MRTRPSSTSFYTYVKAGMVFAATTATYFFARATGVLPSWFNWQESNEVMPFDQPTLASTQVQDFDSPLTNFKEMSLASISTNEKWLYSDQQKLLSVTPTLVNPIDDQIIDATALYQQTLTDIFSENFTFIDVIETGENGLPSWLNLQYNLISSYTMRQTSNVAVKGNRAYVLEDAFNFQIFDVSNPAIPEPFMTNITAISDESCPYCHLVVSGNIAFVPMWLGGLQILNVSNDDLRLIGNYTLTNVGIWDIAISDNLAFLACDSSGLQIVNVSTPSNPQLIGGYSIPSSDARGVAISGRTVFIADWFVGLQIFNASNLTFPQLLATYPVISGGNGFRVVVLGSLAYVSNFNAGLQILNISNPAHPVLLSTYPVSTGGCAYA